MCSHRICSGIVDVSEEGEVISGIRECERYGNKRK